MTREDAKIDICYHEKYVIDSVIKRIDKIYDDFEIKLKQGQENYNKLWDMYGVLKKELGNRTCESCKHNNNQCVLQTIIYNYDCFMDLSRFCCNKYEPKETK